MVTHKSYDFVFIVSGLPYVSYPAGGENIIFQLCSKLKRNGYNTAFIVIKDCRKYLFGIKNDPKILIYKGRHPKLRRIMFSGVFNRWGGVIRKLSGIDYDFNVLNGIDIFFFSTPEEVNIDAKRVIATAWSTADFAGKYVRESGAEGYYLIQHSEDDKSFSGELSRHASDTYKIDDLKKIVINHKMYGRFRSEKPLLFNVGIDYDSFYYNGEKDKVILFPLRRSESKGAEYIIKAVDYLHENLPDWKFMAFGDYTSDIPDPISFYYRAKTQTLKSLYAKSKIFILPSLVEGFSLTVLEAMASGCAVVSTDCGGVDEYMVNGKNGLFVPIKDSKAIAESVMTLVNDNEILKKLAANGQMTAKKYSYDNMYNQFIELFDL